MKKRNEYFILFSNCIPVKGASRSIICDLQLSRYRTIPNLLVEILSHSRNKTISEIKKLYNNQYDKGIDAFVKLLIDEEWGFYTDTPESFPELDLKWESPSLITNFIIDINKKSNFNYKKIIDQLNELRCEALQVRCFDEIDIQTFFNIAEIAKESCLINMEFILKYSMETTTEVLKKIMETNRRIRYFYIHSSPEDKYEILPDNAGNIYYIKQVIDSDNHCGIIHPDFFRVNIELFTEAQKHNTCLNKKLSLDTKGEIRICPSLKKSFGNIKDTPLKSLISNSEIKKMWGINKDQINTCKDCEFRYICTDCRAFLSDENNPLSKPLKCNYDPYTAQWIN